MTLAIESAARRKRSRRLIVLPSFSDVGLHMVPSLVQSVKSINAPTSPEQRLK